jgi:hypothetical protein
MSAQHNGGPAFPVADDVAQSNFGMTLRDWFAGQALAGISAGYWGNVEITGMDSALIAATAYEYADAMLEGRK